MEVDFINIKENYGLIEELRERISKLKKVVMQEDDLKLNVGHPIHKEIEHLIKTFHNLKLVDLNGDFGFIGVPEIDYFLGIIDEVTNDLREEPNFIFSPAVREQIVVSLLIFYIPVDVCVSSEEGSYYKKFDSPNDFGVEIFDEYFAGPNGLKIAAGIWKGYLHFAELNGIFSSSDNARSFDFDSYLYDFYLAHQEEIEMLGGVEDTDELYLIEFDVLAMYLGIDPPFPISHEEIIVKRIVNEQYLWNISETEVAIYLKGKEYKISVPIDFVELFNVIDSLDELNALSKAFMEYLSDIGVLDVSDLKKAEFEFIPLTYTDADLLLLVLVEENLFGPNAFCQDGPNIVRSRKYNPMGDSTDYSIDFDSFKKAWDVQFVNA